MSKLSFFKTLTLTAALYAAVGCSSNIKKVDIPATANPTDEISAAKAELNSATEAQANIFAPTSYEEGKKHLEKAQALADKGGASEKVLDEVGYAKAYLNTAREKSVTASQSLAEVNTARQAALAAGAAKVQQKELAKIDADLKEITATWEKKDKTVSSQDRNALQKRYLDLELNSIRTTRLSAASTQIEDATKMGAKKLAPKSLNLAQTKMSAAETVINSDRHNEAAISAAVAEANAASSKLMAVTRAAKGAKAGTPEDVALDMVGQSATINALDKQVGAAQDETNMTAAQLAEKNAQLQQTNEQLNSTQNKAQMTAAQLAAEKKYNESFEQARQQFDPKEADVYRQGNQLLIRLKNINFASGRSDLPAASMSSLGKVKEIIKDMNAQKVVVEGHTDSIGAKDLNEKLSQGRAEAVAKYFESEKVIDSQNVEAKGFGFEKPISTNKTKEGRAQNRRVDVVITPASESM